jgi:hypothetical protein
MIPTIEEILVKLANGDMAIDDADHWIREHLSLAEDTGHLRDLYAGLAMQGVVASAEGDNQINPTVLASWSYKMADAMLEARAR